MPPKLVPILAALVVPIAVVVGVVLVATLTLPSVTVTVERASYSIGDTVRFAIRNGLSEPVFLPCTAPWRIVRDVGGDWRPVESHGCLEIILELPPGAAKTWEWEAKSQADDPDVVPVGPSGYRVEVTVLMGCQQSSERCERISVRAEFRLG